VAVEVGVGQVYDRVVVPGVDAGRACREAVVVGIADFLLLLAEWGC